MDSQLSAWSACVIDWIFRWFVVARMITRLNTFDGGIDLNQLIWSLRMKGGKEIFGCFSKYLIILLVLFGLFALTFPADYFALVFS